MKTEYKDRLLKGSVYIHDSMYVYKNGDSLFYLMWNTEYRNKFINDTGRIRDSIRVPIPVKVDTIEVNKLKWYQEASVWSTSLVLVELALYLLIKYSSFISGITITDRLFYIKFWVDIF
ncbi:MAG: hypothetical protein ACK5MK_04285 [Dysgonomonas sp.]